MSRQNSTNSLSSNSGIPSLMSKRGSGSLSREPSPKVALDGKNSGEKRTSDLGSLASEDLDQVKSNLW